MLTSRLLPTMEHIQWNFSRDWNIFIKENAFEIFVCKNGGQLGRLRRFVILSQVCDLVVRMRTSVEAYLILNSCHVLYNDKCLTAIFSHGGIFLTLIWQKILTRSERWCSTTKCFLNRLLKAQIKENIKAPRHWPLCGEFTGSPHKWPVTRKMFAFDDVIMGVKQTGVMTSGSYACTGDIGHRCIRNSTADNMINITNVATI